MIPDLSTVSENIALLKGLAATRPLRVKTGNGAASFNASGILPLDLRVLVLPDAAEAVTKGGIILPEPEVEKQKYAQCKATLVSVGVNAFSEAKRNPDFVPPAAGDRVLISKYGGIMVKGKDGIEYRLMNDEDVTARLEE